MLGLILYHKSDLKRSFFLKKKANWLHLSHKNKVVLPGCHQKVKLQINQVTVLNTE